MPFLSVSFRAKDQWEAEDPILGDDQLGIEAVAVEPDGTLVFELNHETGQVQAKYKRGREQTSWNTLPYEGLLNLYEDPGLISADDFALVKQTADGAWTAAGQALEKAGQAETAARSAEEKAETALQTAGAVVELEAQHGDDMSFMLFAAAITASQGLISTTTNGIELFKLGGYQ